MFKNGTKKAKNKNRETDGYEMDKAGVRRTIKLANFVCQ